MKRAYVTATDIYKYFQCPHWPYYDRFATEEEKTFRREQTDGEKARQEDGIAHEDRIVQKLLKDQTVITAPVTRDAIKDCEETMKLMRQGVPWIYQGTLTHGNRTGRPDLLERREGESLFGDWHYVPVDVKTSTRLQKYQKMQLAFYAGLLEDLQGRAPNEASIINIEGQCLPFSPADVREESRGLMADLEAVVSGTKPDLVLRKSCFDVGTWGELCEHYAKESNDIALLYKVDVQKLKALRSLGVRTVDEAARIDPFQIAGSAKGLTHHALDVITRQAQSLRDESVIIRKDVELPGRGLEIHFDIESDPPNDVDYLYGFLVRGEDGDRYQAFVAKTLEEEDGMWRKFLAWLETLPLEYVVYHFSPYERTRLEVMKNRYGGSHWLDLFISHMVDLKDYASSHVTFPLYFYGLKYVAKFLGFRWRGDLVKSGGESVDQFERYLETQDQNILDEIIRYNEDDVRATAFLKDWFTAYATAEKIYERPYPWESGKNPFISPLPPSSRGNRKQENLRDLPS